MEDPEKTCLAKAARHYKLLFTLPERWSIIILTFLISVTGSLTAFAIAYQSWDGVMKGLVFSLQVLILPTMAADLVLSCFVIKEDDVLDKRRMAGLSLVVCVVWIIAINVGAVFQTAIKESLLLSFASVFAVCLSVSIRYLVFTTVSQLKLWQLSLATLLQPVTYFLSLLFFFNLWQPPVFSAVFTSSIILLVSTYVFVQMINRRGEEAIGIGAISLFKGFMVNWVAGATSPLEERFESLGSNASVLVSLIAFKKGKSIDAVMVVPRIHPGPFKNLGSSNLPYLIQRALEEKLNGVVAVPHGTCGHELNLTSQEQCRKVLQEVSGLAEFSNYNSKATRFVREENNLAKASCQIFGDVALVTVTCAPASMEDVSEKVGLEIMERGRKLGAKDVIVVDAHNSIGSSKEVVVLSKEELQEILFAAEKAVKKALKEERLPFKVGVAKIHPKEFGVKEGIGPGGIVALTVIIGEQKVAYVIIDGNNMISGFREEILESLKNLIHGGEVLTTDTHVVNAVLSIDRGYYPVGEAVDKERLITHIEEAVSQALANTGDSETAYKIGEIPDVKVLGEENLLTLSVLVDSVYKFMKTLAPIMYIPTLTLALLSFKIIFSG